MSKIWKVLQWVIVVILMVVGLALIFNEQIKSYVVNHMSQTAISKPVDTKTKHKGNFDFESVKAVDIKELVRLLKMILLQLEKLRFQVSV